MQAHLPELLLTLHHATKSACHRLTPAAAQDLEAQIAGFDKDRGKRLKAAQAKQAKAKAGLEAARAGLKDRQAQASQAAAEMEAAEGERVSLRQQLQAAEAALAGVLIQNEVHEP